MKKSHRKEIIIARIIFGVIVIAFLALVVGIGMFISSRFKKTADTPPKDVTTQTVEEVSEHKEYLTDQEVEDLLDEYESLGDGLISENTEEIKDSDKILDSGELRWTTASVNFREEPNRDCEVITALPEGTKVQYLTIESGWAKVIYQGQTGYISGEYLTSENPDAQ